MNRVNTSEPASDAPGTARIQWGPSLVSVNACFAGTTLAERMLTRYHTVWGENIAHAYEADFQY